MVTKMCFFSHSTLGFKQEHLEKRRSQWWTLGLELARTEAITVACCWVYLAYVTVTLAQNLRSRRLHSAENVARPFALQRSRIL